MSSWGWKFFSDEKHFSWFPLRISASLERFLLQLRHSKTWLQSKYTFYILSHKTCCQKFAVLVKKNFFTYPKENSCQVQKLLVVLFENVMKIILYSALQHKNEKENPNLLQLRSSPLILSSTVYFMMCQYFPAFFIRRHCFMYRGDLNELGIITQHSVVQYYGKKWIKNGLKLSRHCYFKSTCKNR